MAPRYNENVDSTIATSKGPMYKTWIFASGNSANHRQVEGWINIIYNMTYSLLIAQIHTVALETIWYITSQQPSWLQRSILGLPISNCSRSRKLGSSGNWPILIKLILCTWGDDSRFCFRIFLQPKIRTILKDLPCSVIRWVNHGLQVA